MLNDLGCSDAETIDEVIAGFNMTGWALESGIFPNFVRPAGLTAEQLRGIALGLNHAVVNSLKAAEPSLDEPTWKETQLEVKKGLFSPYEVTDLESMHDDFSALV